MLHIQQNCGRRVLRNTIEDENETDPDFIPEIHDEDEDERAVVQDDYDIEGLLRELDYIQPARKRK